MPAAKPQIKLFRGMFGQPTFCWQNRVRMPSFRSGWQMFLYRAISAECERGCITGKHTSKNKSDRSRFVCRNETGVIFLLFFGSAGVSSLSGAWWNLFATMTMRLCFTTFLSLHSSSLKQPSTVSNCGRQKRERGVEDFSR